MKGIEWKVSMGILLLVLLFVLMVVAFILPMQKTGQGMSSEKDFRWYCMFWSRNGYRGVSTDIDEVTVQMSPYCTKALGIFCPTPDDGSGGCMPNNNDPNSPEYEKCRNMCRNRVTEA